MVAKNKVTIIGAGFSGLVQAYYLVKAGYPVEILEKTGRAGGLLGTRQESGFLIEQAANAFLANRDLEALAQEIQVPLVSKLSQAQKRYIYRDKKMRRLPVAWTELWPIAKFIITKKIGWKNYRALEEESMEDWSQKNFGHSLTRYLVEPALQGIYATGCQNLDAELLLTSMSQKSKKGKLRGSVSPLGGMGQFIDGLKDFLIGQGVSIIYNASALQMQSIDGPTIYAVDLQSLKALANQNKIPLPDSLFSTESASLTSVTIGFQGEAEAQGFGCLFPKSENFYALGVLFNNSIFPARSESGFSETWILNDRDVLFSEMSPETLLEYVYSDRARLFGKKESPCLQSVSQWSRRIPIYNLELKKFLRDWKQGQKKGDPLLVGNYLGSLGLSKILRLAQDNVMKIQGGWFG